MIHLTCINHCDHNYQPEGAQDLVDTNELREQTCWGQPLLCFAPLGSPWAIDTAIFGGPLLLSGPLLLTFHVDTNYMASMATLVSVLAIGSRQSAHRYANSTVLQCHVANASALLGPSYTRELEVQSQEVRPATIQQQLCKA